MGGRRIIGGEEKTNSRRSGEEKTRRGWERLEVKGEGRGEGTLLLTCHNQVDLVNVTC